MLCNFGCSFPDFVGDLLEREAGLARRFREESITDMWVGALVPLRSYGVRVDFANEAQTGADLELWFLSKRLDRALGFVVQAKRAECHRATSFPFSCTLGDWRKHRFPEIDHRGGKSKSTLKERIKGSQARDLVRAARRTGRNVYPLYAFYTPSHICRLSRNVVQGVMLADGFEVRRRIVRGLWSTRRRGGAKRRSYASFKQIGALQDLLIPLSAMFCVKPPTPLAEIDDLTNITANVIFQLIAAGRIGIANIPEPEEVAEAMSRAIASAGSEGRTSVRPEVTTNIPPDIRLLASGEPAPYPDHSAGSRPPRIRVAFVATTDRSEKS